MRWDYVPTNISKSMTDTMLVHYLLSQQPPISPLKNNPKTKDLCNNFNVSLSEGGHQFGE